MSLREAAHKSGVSVDAVRKWCKQGVRGAVLESYFVGGQRFTTQEAYRRFFLKMNQ